tara:strand:- start:534 stop:749 length:216 start_codon:yes stop_codon:yes gene_type:complete
MYKALLAHFQAQREEALALLGLYMGDPQAVADHSDILEEMVKWTKKLCEAEEALECLKRNINFNSPEIPPQ